jgi:protein-L-isoaspartate(D-aspartate) O-methyltransferase
MEPLAEKQTLEALRASMVTNQLSPNGVVDPHLLHAFMQLPREAFCPTSLQERCYSDSEIPVSSQRLLLPPLVVGRMAQCAQITNTSRILVIAAGAGYLAALLALQNPHVYALENHENPYLMAAATRFNFQVYQGAFELAHKDLEPFDYVFVDSGSMEYLPPWLWHYINKTGYLIGLVQTKPEEIGKIQVYTKRGNALSAPCFDAAATALPEFKKVDTFTF